MDMDWRFTDPCLYYKWTEQGLDIAVSWIDDNLIVGNEANVAQTKADQMDQFDCKDCGELNERLGNKNTKL